jgi:uncharacterized protein (TIGR02391 family)
MNLEQFETLVRHAGQFTQEPVSGGERLHPFEQREIYEGFPAKVRRLFDDAHYAEATFEAFKFLDKTVAAMAGSKESGQKLMMQAFSEQGPIRLSGLTTESERDEQKGFQFIFAGAMSAVRNPRGHEHSQFDSPELCLDHLSLASLLLRRLEEAGNGTS